MPAKPTSSKPNKATPAKAKTVAVKKTAVAAKKAVKPERTDVFVSYSRLDKEWLSGLQTHLKPLVRDHGINIWDDTKIKSGDKWRVEIDKALAKSKVAILLVSANFMASDFIIKDELPPLLKAAEKEGVIILSVIVGRNGAYNNHPISKYQAVNDPSNPLNKLTGGEVDDVFYQVYKRIYGIFAAPTSNTSRSALPKAIKSETVKEPTPSKTKSTVTRLQKKKPDKVSTSDNSTKALLVKSTGEWLVIPVVKGVVNDEIQLDMRVNTSGQRAFLRSLRQYNNLDSIVFKSQTYFCKSQDLQMNTTGNQEVWHVKGMLSTSNRQLGVTYGYIGLENQAEINARLLLLNEKPTKDQSLPFFFHPTLPNGGESPLPILYKQLNRQAAAFKQNAVLIMTWFLQVSNVVQHIHKLSFTLREDTLSVQFEGERDSQYQNTLSEIIKITGKINLSETTEQQTLKLIIQR